MARRSTPSKAGPADALLDYVRRIGIAILPRAVWLLLLGMLISLVLVDWTSLTPVVAARDAVLNEHMRQQAYDRPPPDSDLALALVAIEAQQCSGSAALMPCSPSPLVNRAHLAELLADVVSSGAPVIAIDVLPARRAEACDLETRQLLMAISNASRRAMILLPRGVIGEAQAFRDLPSFFEQCPDIAVARPDNIFLGHPLLMEIDGSDGLVGAVATWVIADIEGGTGQADLYRRRIPALALVLAEALRSPDATALRARMDAWGLETRLQTYPAQAVAIDDSLCTRLADACRSLDRSGMVSPAPVRVNFHFGWLNGTPKSSAQIAKAAQLAIVPDRFFNAERAAAFAAKPIDGVILAATDGAYGDLHYTPIGRIPGGLILANTAFNFDQAAFLKSAPPSPDLLGAFVECLQIAVVSALVAAALALAACAIKARRKKSDVSAELEWTWPVALMATSAINALQAWGTMHDEFDNGLLTFTIVAFVLALVELRSSLEQIAFSMYSAAVGWLKSAWSRRQSRGKA